jgi:hypothetical protein
MPQVSSCALAAMGFMSAAAIALAIALGVTFTNRPESSPSLAAGVHTEDNGISPRSGITLLGNTSDDTCPLPPPFYPNHFYDLWAPCELSPQEQEILDVESAAFRLITSQAHRVGECHTSLSVLRVDLKLLVNFHMPR